MTPSAPLRVLDAIAAGRATEAAALVFEYMAMTQAETGRLVPDGIDRLPSVLRTECENLGSFSRAPGALLLAYRDQQPIACVGLKPLPRPGVLEVERLYVRPAHRGGVARVLMNHAHRHAHRHGFTRLVLDVIPERRTVIDFYRRLGYTDTVPYAPEPFTMIYLERRTSPSDGTLENHGS
jgi:GNAT superfamily N-acetyltransferase